MNDLKQKVGELQTDHLLNNGGQFALIQSKSHSTRETDFVTVKMFPEDMTDLPVDVLKFISAVDGEVVDKESDAMELNGEAYDRIEVRVE